MHDYANVKLHNQYVALIDINFLPRNQLYTSISVSFYTIDLHSDNTNTKSLLN